MYKPEKAIRLFTLLPAKDISPAYKSFLSGELIQPFRMYLVGQQLAVPRNIQRLRKPLKLILKKNKNSKDVPT